MMRGAQRLAQPGVYLGVGGGADPVIFASQYSTGRQRSETFVLSMAGDIIGASTFESFIANDKPFLVRYDGSFYFPAVRTYAETTFGGDFATPTDYLDPLIQQNLAKGDNFIFAGQLLECELVVRHVLVERLDHVVAVAKRLGDRVERGVAQQGPKFAEWRRQGDGKGLVIYLLQARQHFGGRHDFGVGRV